MALASQEDPLAPVFRRHAWVVDQLAEHYLPSEAQNAPSLPRQKNIKARPLATPAPALVQKEAPPPVNLSFQARTVWADLKADVTNYHSYFHVVVQSSSPAQGWMLKRNSTKEVLLKGGVSEGFTFNFDANFPFDNDLSLTVMIEREGFTNPALLPFFQIQRGNKP